MKDEIWGCTHYMGIPLETVMRLPIQDRRYYIQKHNAEQAALKTRYEKQSGYHSYDGETINQFARNEQENIKNRRMGG